MKLYSYLVHNPQIGIISGVISNRVLVIQQMFTDDHILKIASGIAVYAGALVAVLTAIVWSIRLFDVLKTRLKK